MNQKRRKLKRKQGKNGKKLKNNMQNISNNPPIWTKFLPSNEESRKFKKLRINYISKKDADFMVRMGLVIVFGAIIGSMILANYVYIQYQTNFIEVDAGEIVTVGPVEYVVTFEGTHEGSKEVKPENIFVKIGITAKNISDEKTALSGGQFYLIDEKDQKHKAVFGEFTAKDLLIVGLDPGNPIEVTTQFDIPFDEDENYKIVIRPQKDQSTVDTASICLTNC